MREFDIHHINRRFDRSLEKLKESKILKKDKELILEFKDFAHSNGLTKNRILKYLNILLKLSGWKNIPFEQATKKDIIRLVGLIEQQELAEWTKNGHKIILKRFYKWLNGDEEYPETVKWIKTGIKQSRKKLPEELLTPEDVNKMIEVANHSRDKALVSLLYESGCRIGEILTMRMKSVVFDDHGARITVSGKKGMRRVRVVSSVPYLAIWISNHKKKDDPEAPLWTRLDIKSRIEIVKYPAIRKMIATLGKKAEINKKIHPHLFRHSRATSMANHMTEAQMNQYFGWVQGSEMPATYVHLSGRDVEATILKLNGIKVEEKEDQNVYSARRCQRCEKMNPPSGKFCLRCGCPLDIDGVMKVENKKKEMEDLMAFLLKDPEIKNVIMNRIRIMRGAQVMPP